MDGGISPLSSIHEFETCPKQSLQAFHLFYFSLPFEGLGLEVENTWFTLELILTINGYTFTMCSLGFLSNNLEVALNETTQKG